MIGYARLLIARNMPNCSTIPGLISVIYLGHKANEPLMWSPSELADGFEPHGQSYSSPCTCWRGVELMSGGGVPGVVRAGWVPGRCYTGYPPSGSPAGQIEAYLRIYIINWFIRPFD